MRYPDTIERHVIIVDTPSGWAPGRGDVEMITNWSNQVVEAHFFTMTHPGRVGQEDDGVAVFLDAEYSKIILDSGEWKPWYNSVYTAESIEEKQQMVDRLLETVSVLKIELAEARSKLPEMLDHYAKEEAKQC